MYFENLWKHSRVRFYVLNSYHNYHFWLKSKRIYKTITYPEPINDFEMDYSFKVLQKSKIIVKKRFVGYLYDNQIYLDNPGIPNIDRGTWVSWKNKGLIN